MRSLKYKWTKSGWFFLNHDTFCNCNWTRTQNHLVRKRTNVWAVLWALICTVHLTVCSSYLTYTFQRLFTLSTCLNVKKIFTQSRWEIWSLSDCNWAQNHLVRKRNTPPFSRTGPFEWPGWVFVSKLSGSRFESSCSFFVVFFFQLQLLKLKISRLLRARSSLTFRKV